MDTATMTAKVHGMNGKMVDPDWAPLALDEVRALLAQFPDLGVPTEILTVSPRPFSAASVVATRNGPVFIKRHPMQVRDREGLLEEHRFLIHLCEHGAPVPHVFEDEWGETAIENAEWTYEVHSASGGVDLYDEVLSWTPFLTAAHAYSAGRALAKLHLASEGFSAPQRQPRPLVAGFNIFAAQDPAAALDRYLSQRPALANDPVARDGGQQAIELLAPFHAELLPLLPALAPLWTHNDLHGSNLLWSDRTDLAQVRTIVDFGLSDRTNAVHDLAQAIERSIVEWLELAPNSTDGLEVPVHLDHLRALLDGYEQIRPLSAQEAAALAPMAALCHAEFALTEADYFLGVLGSHHKSRVASQDYLVGHARWYRSPGGETLLDAIRLRAETKESVEAR